MTNVALVLSCVAVAAVCAAMWLLPGRAAAAVRALLSDRLAGFETGQERLERLVRDEIAKNRGEAATTAHQLREEVRATLKDATESILRDVGSFGDRLDAFTKAVEQKLGAFQLTVEERLRHSREESGQKLDQ